jgi:ADP-ribose pyrophosphatase YjhB (NUDIX family)
MNAIEKSYWYIIDTLKYKSLDKRLFFKNFIHDLCVKIPSTVIDKSYIRGWEKWKKTCVVSGIALVSKMSGQYRVLMVKNKNTNYPHLSTTWPGGKPDLYDYTLWGQATREFYEEVGIDLRLDSHLVTHILTNVRAVSFVVVIDENDPRLNDIKLDAREIHSYEWLPITFNNIKIMRGKLCSSHIDDGHIYMGELPASGFRKLQKLNHIDHRQDVVDKYLYMNPWSITSGSIEQVSNDFIN